MNFKISKALIISPHPDDETLGVGGSIKRFIDNGVSVSILVVGAHMPPLYSEKEHEQTIHEAKKAFAELGVKNFNFLNIPATKINELPIAELNGMISKYVYEFEPDTVFLPFPDRHIDHKVVFESSIVSCRPNRINAPSKVLMYETVSETRWNVFGAEHTFAPDFYINIDDTLKYKISAFDCYKSQNQNTPSRSVDSIEALAKFRGSQNGCTYAEAFKVARIVI